MLGARHKDLAPADKDRVLSLLAIGFEAGEDPSGKVVLYFAGDVTVQLDVECIEAEMRDLGPAWRTRNKPEHPGEGEGNGQNDANEPAGSNPNGSEAADA